MISDGKAMAPSVFVLLIAMIDFALFSDRGLLFFGDVLLLLSMVILLLLLPSLGIF